MGQISLAKAYLISTYFEIYRTWVLWSYNWKVVAFPIVLLTFNIIVSFLISASMSTKVSIFNGIAFDRLVQTYNSIAFALSVITVGLMSYRIWITHRKVAHSLVGERKLLSIMWFFIESAALQIITEFVLFVSTCTGFVNSQFIVLELIAPLVGITFNSITVRIKLQSLKEAGLQTQDANNPVQTIGSIPLRHIKINITEEVENDTEYSKITPESSVLDRKFQE
ncbi:hypothetical protein BDQ17DRAFT_1376745, partial [Cyathus striatus]